MCVCGEHSGEINDVCLCGDHNGEIYNVCVCVVITMVGRLSGKEIIVC